MPAFLKSCCLALTLTLPLTAGAQQRNVFGEARLSEAALMGIFYDLKQTQDGKPTGVGPDRYFSVLEEFLAAGMDESVLNRYYRVTRPLFTTQIFIPNMNADAAPKAFNAPPSVKPAMWVIHYKGQVSPPETGVYRLTGCADDFIAAAINGKLVLVHPQRFLNSVWPRTAQTNPPGQMYGGGQRMLSGDWFEAQAGQIYDLDVLIGERPGGQFNAILTIEKQGGTYAKNGYGPILPVFQVAPYDTPVPDKGRAAPPIALDGKPWKSYQ